jgi:hypothetical protein
MSREMLLAVGLRVMVLPALVGGVLAIALVAFSRASELNGFPRAQIRRLVDRVRRRLRRLSGKGAKPNGGPAREPAAAGSLSRRFQPPQHAGSPTTHRHAGNQDRRHKWLTGIGVVVLLVFLLPFSVGGMAWLSVVLVIIYWWRGFGFTARPSRDVSEIRLAIVVIAVAAIISLGRQFDEPVQLLEATVEFPQTAKQPVPPVDGVLVSADDKVIYLGDREDGVIRALRREDVSRLVLGPPIEYAPPHSILSRVLGGGDRWSVTPVGLWCDGLRYNWLHLGDRCKGTPTAVLRPDQPAYHIVADDQGDAKNEHRKKPAGVVTIWIRCPKEAPHNCDGYARLSTVKEYGPPALGVLSKPRHLPLPPLRDDATEFSVEPNRTWWTNIPVRMNDWTTLATKPAMRDPAVQQLVPMEVTLSADPRGKSVYSTIERNVRFTRPPELDEEPTHLRPAPDELPQQ